MLVGWKFVFVMLWNVRVDGNWGGLRRGVGTARCKQDRIGVAAVDALENEGLINDNFLKRAAMR